MTGASPPVSVVIPAFNRAASIRPAIESVLRQSWRDFEIVVVDDGSTDFTPEAVRAIEDPRLRLVEAPRNLGAGAARNLGIEEARGDWIAFQDSDDDWLPEKLARQAAFQAGLPGDYVASFCTKIDYGFDGKGRYGARLASCMPDPSETIVSGDLSRRLLRGNIIGPQTALISKAAFLAAGGFDTRLRNNEDWDFFIRLSEAGPIGFLDDPLAVVIVSDDSISRRQMSSACSFVRVFGKIRRKKPRDSELLGALASEVSSKLRNIGRRKFERRYLYYSIYYDSLKYKPYIKLIRSYMAF